MIIIAEEDGRSMKTALPVGPCRAAVFATWKSQLCVWANLFIKVHKKAKSFGGHSFLKYKLNSFSKAALSLIYCGISRAASPDIANVIFQALRAHCNIYNSAKKKIII